MTFALLALICLAGIAGPVLAVSHRWGLPVVVGELAAGVALGPLGAHLLDGADAGFRFLADVGFALVMFVAGSHVPVRDRRLRGALVVGTLRAMLVAGVSVPVAVALAHLFGTGHAALYAVLLSSSSAALVLPIITAVQLSGVEILRLFSQVAVADTACIVAIPLVIDPSRAARSALGAAAVITGGTLLFAGLWLVERRGWRKRLHRLSEKRKFALELRISLALLFGLAAVAQTAGVSVMLAGFVAGLAVAAVGEPRRLARQLFAVTEGLFGPVFFLWLGTSLDLQALGRRPLLVGLGVALGLAAALTHLVARLTGQPAGLGVLASAQLGVPVAAATLGSRSHLLADGEPAALVLGALVTVLCSSLAAGRAARLGRKVPAADALSTVTATATEPEPTTHRHRRVDPT